MELPPSIRVLLAHGERCACLPRMQFCDREEITWPRILPAIDRSGLLLYFASMSSSVLLENLVRDAKTFEPFPEFPFTLPAELDRWIDSLQVQPVSALEWEWPKVFAVGPRTVTDSMWFFIARGSVQVWVADKSRRATLREGDLVLIPQDTRHCIIPDGNEQAVVIAVHFFATIFGVDFLRCLGFPFALHANPYHSYKETSGQLAHEFAVKAPGWRRRMSELISRLLLDAIRFEFRGFSTTERHDAAALPRLFPALEWMDQHIGQETLEVKRIADAVNLSPPHFRRLFRSTFKMSPVQFMRARKVERACLLLRTTDLGLKEIAQQCGFNELGYFCRTFRKLVHCTPSEYRKTLPV